MPIMPQYRSPYGQSIAELLMRQGDAAARAAERSGMLWANAAQNIGQIGAQAYEQHREQKDQQTRNLGISKALDTWDGKDIGSLYRATAVYTKSPQDALRLASSVAAFQELGVKQDERNQERLGIALSGVDLIPDEKFVQLYPELRAKAQAAGFDVGQFPEQADVSLKPVLNRMGMALRGEKPTERGPENPENVVINGQATVATPSEIARAKAQGATVEPYTTPTKTTAEIEAEAEARARGTRAGNPPAPPQRAGSWVQMDGPNGPVFYNPETQQTRSAPPGVAPKGDPGASEMFLPQEGIVITSYGQKQRDEVRREAASRGIPVFETAGAQSKAAVLAGIVRDAKQLNDLLKDEDVQKSMGWWSGRITRGLSKVSDLPPNVQTALQLMDSLSDTELRKRTGAAAGEPEMQRIFRFSTDINKGMGHNTTAVTKMLESGSDDYRMLSGGVKLWEPKAESGSGEAPPRPPNVPPEAKWDAGSRRWKI